MKGRCWLGQKRQAVWGPNKGGGPRTRAHVPPSSGGRRGDEALGGGDL